MSEQAVSLQSQLAYAVQDEWPVTEIARTFGMTRRRATKVVAELGGKPWSKSDAGTFGMNLRVVSR
jgi:hypothetical protein